MLDDRDLIGGRVFAIGQAALRALAGIVQRVQVAGVAEHHCTHADADARLVHHLEHVAQAMVRFAHQVADAVAVITEVQRGRGGAAPAHLVEQPGQHHVVALAQAAVIVDQKLRHDKQADTFNAWRGIRQLGQHHVHDVFRQRMVATRDKDLVALEPVGTVFSWLGAGADV